jgi:hypothetical protein
MQGSPHPNPEPDTPSQSTPGAAETVSIHAACQPLSRGSNSSMAPPPALTATSSFVLGALAPRSARRRTHGARNPTPLNSNLAAACCAYEENRVWPCLPGVGYTEPMTCRQVSSQHDNHTLSKAEPTRAEQDTKIRRLIIAYAYRPSSPAFPALGFQRHSHKL